MVYLFLLDFKEFSKIQKEKCVMKILLLLICLVTMLGCQSTHYSYKNIDDYEKLLQETANVKPPVAGSSEEKRALKRFKEFYKVYSTEVIEEGMEDLYAEDIWFGDPFHSVQGIDKTKKYFLAMAEPVEKCTFTINPVHRDGINYYFHWIINLEIKASKNNSIKALGISFVRFNEAGKIVFQQDYWDTSVMFDRIPVVGFWTRYAKKRIMKEAD